MQATQGIDRLTRAFLIAAVAAVAVFAGLMASSQQAMAVESDMASGIAASIDGDVPAALPGLDGVYVDAAAPALAPAKASWKKMKAGVMYTGYYSYFYGVKIKAKVGFKSVKVVKKGKKKIVSLRWVVLYDKLTKKQFKKAAANKAAGVPASYSDDIVFNGVDWRYRSQGKILASVTAKFGDPKTTSKTLYKGTKYEINWPVKVVKSVKITAPKNYAYLTIALGQKDKNGSIASYRYIRIK